MDDRMAFYRENWNITNLTKDLFAIGFNMLISKLHKFFLNKITFS